MGNREGQCSHEWRYLYIVGDLFSATQEGIRSAFTQTDVFACAHCLAYAARPHMYEAEATQIADACTIRW